MLLIKNADRVYTMEGPPLANADILIQDGKVAAVGQGLSAEGAEILDAKGLVALPGLVDAHTHHGGFGMTPGSDKQDLNEMTSAATPEVQALHGVDIFDANFRHTVKCGVTSICVLPGSGNVIGGLAFAAKTSGESLSGMVIKNPCAMKVAFGINPKNFHGAKGRAPMTRMGVAAILRGALRDAQAYMQKQEAAGDDPEKRPSYNAKHEAFIPVLRGEIPLKMHCEQFDMLTAISIAQEFGCRYMIEHAWASEHFYDELVAGGGAINYGPIGVIAGYGELTGANIYEVIELDKRGLCVSVITDGPIYSEDVLVMQVGDAVRWGMDHERALRMITINPAKAMEIDSRVGSLAPGKDGDVALFRGIPALDVNATVAYTVQEGRIVYTQLT